jgi:N-terminal domain of oxidoreductase
MPMAASVNRQILLKSRPEGAPGLGNFELAKTPVPEPGDGEVLMRTLYLARPIHARPYERREILRQAGRRRGAHGGRHGRRDCEVTKSQIRPGRYRDKVATSTRLWIGYSFEFAFHTGVSMFDRAILATR